VFSNLKYNNRLQQPRELRYKPNKPIHQTIS
jgi:hypothetical protein